MTDTKPINAKCCSRCGIIKSEDKFNVRNNICKECRNERDREKYKNNLENNIEQKCNICVKDLPISDFVKNTKTCKDCNNKRRRDKYNNNVEHHLKLRQAASQYKHNKVIKKQKLRELEIAKIENEIGKENKCCKYCNKISPKINFRHNRLKCLDCEKKDGRDYRQSDIGKIKSNIWLENNKSRMTELQRNWAANKRLTDPIFKFKSVIRSRIVDAIKSKQLRTIEYLDCNVNEFLQWLFYKSNEDFRFENHGDVWHIDHVIPVSKFNLENPYEQLIAFNWRNTAALSVKDNLSKGSKIIVPQIEEHFKNLLEYHKEYEIEMPKDYIDLFAKHLDAGNPLEFLLPLANGNISEELS